MILRLIGLTPGHAEIDQGLTGTEEIRIAPGKVGMILRLVGLTPGQIGIALG